MKINQLVRTKHWKAKIDEFQTILFENMVLYIRAFVERLDNQQTNKNIIWINIRKEINHYLS